jgi:hypothetical protein
MDISTSAGDCALALAHLVLPALTWLRLTARSDHPSGSDVVKLLSYVTRHAHGPQDTQPLQSVLISNERASMDILAWPMPDITDEVYGPPTWRMATLNTRVALSVTDWDWIIPDTYAWILNEAMTALPLDGLVTLTVQDRTRLDEQFWLCHAPRWPLLQRVRLATPAARGFREMLLLQDNDEPERPLLPWLTKLDLIGDTALSVRRTIRLCDALMNRVEQGVPLETLDLSMCRATDLAVRLLSEIVADVWGPEARDLRRFVPDDDSGAEDYSDDEDEEIDDEEEE